MQVVILSGGTGSRISEENFLKPKPMIEIGGRPILWHIMRFFCNFGHNDFLICLGHKQEIVKKFFLDYFAIEQDIEVNLKTNNIKVLNEDIFDCNVKLVNTGIETMTAGRLKRVEKYLEDEFFLVYGDSLGNIDIDEELKSFKHSGKLLTICAVKFSSQKGVIDVDENNVITSFREKSINDDVYVNSGYMICKKGILRFIDDDSSALDLDVFPKLINANEVNFFKHYDKWKFVEKESDVKELNKIWHNNNQFW